MTHTHTHTSENGRHTVSFRNVYQKEDKKTNLQRYQSIYVFTPHNWFLNKSFIKDRSRNTVYD